MAGSVPHLGELRPEDLTPDRIERWAATEIDPNCRMANRTREKTITVFHGVMERARKLYRLPVNPVADVEKPRTASRTEIQVFSPEEVMALVRAAADAQDAAIYLTAAFTGMRQGEPLALRWRDVDFPRSAIRVRMSYTNGLLTSPKSGKVRSVPMAPRRSPVSGSASSSSTRTTWCSSGSPAASSTFGAAKRHRAALELAGLRPLRFHDLRHTIGASLVLPT